MASYSRALRDYILETGSLKAAIAGFFVTVYDGPIPYNANPSLPDAEAAISASNHVLGVYKAYQPAGGAIMNTDGGLTWGDASGGSLSKNPLETWKSIAADTASGTATFARIQDTDDTGGNDAAGTKLRVQLTMGSSGDADWVQSSLVYSAGVEKTITAASLSIPSLE